MNKPGNLLKNSSVVLGFLSLIFLGFDFFVFSTLQPKMVSFERLDAVQEGLFNGVGLGLLVFLGFCLTSLFRLGKYLKKAESVRFSSILLVVMGVLSFLLVFADGALLNDIGKQYRHGLAQPEWLLLYFAIGFQVVSSVFITFYLLFGFKKEDQVNLVGRDSNIFLMVQFVGLICGLMGLASTSLGFIFPRGWTLLVHTVMSSITLLFPYGLAVGYWLVTKLKEENRQWYDEKQLQDVGKSAFLTLILSVVLMTAIFIIHYNNLSGIVSILWLPLYLFAVLFLFSSGSLYFYGKA
jgi:hypothetical protein